MKKLLMAVATVMVIAACAGTPSWRTSDVPAPGTEYRFLCQSSGEIPTTETGPGRDLPYHHYGGPYFSGPRLTFQDPYSHPGHFSPGESPPLPCPSTGADSGSRG